MGADKALLELVGRPLIEHAVTKLRRVTARVHILSANPAFAVYAPLVPDLHPGTGPIGGIEAALAHTSTEWTLILPVDVPLLPTALLEWWIGTVRRRTPRVGVALFGVEGRPQPTVLLVRREARPVLTRAIAQGEYKLMTALEAVARELAGPDAPVHQRVPYVLPVDANFKFQGWQPPYPAHPQPWQILTPAQRTAQPLWFTNLNTPEEFAAIEDHTDALDT
jgi:molybdopterin-guanine dinucleotide biosynthesis protein A